MHCSVPKDYLIRLRLVSFRHCRITSGDAFCHTTFPNKHDWDTLGRFRSAILCLQRRWTWHAKIKSRILLRCGCSGVEAPAIPFRKLLTWKQIFKSTTVSLGLLLFIGQVQNASLMDRVEQASMNGSWPNICYRANTQLEPTARQLFFNRDFPKITWLFPWLTVSATYMAPPSHQFSKCHYALSFCRRHFFRHSNSISWSPR